MVGYVQIMEITGLTSTGLAETLISSPFLKGNFGMSMQDLSQLDVSVVGDSRTRYPGCFPRFPRIQVAFRLHLQPLSSGSSRVIVLTATHPEGQYF